MGKELFKRLVAEGVERGAARTRSNALRKAIVQSLDEVNKKQWDVLYSSGAAKKAAGREFSRSERQAMGRFAERAMAGGRNAPESLRRIKPSEFKRRAKVGGYEEASVQRAAQRAAEKAAKARGPRSGAATEAQRRFRRTERVTDVKARERIAKSRRTTEQWKSGRGKKKGDKR
jgi:hypothetical protein